MNTGLIIYYVVRLERLRVNEIPELNLRHQSTLLADINICRSGEILTPEEQARRIDAQLDQLTEESNKIQEGLEAATLEDLLEAYSEVVSREDGEDKNAVLNLLALAR